MIKFTTISFLTAICFTSVAHAGDCGPTQLKSIDPSKFGDVWLKFTNGTQFAMKVDTDVGLKNTLSVALSAFAMNANVIISLDDDTQCSAGGNATSWRYLKLVK